jgi:uroporphyrinogen III methyltransferase / synthase
MSTEPVGVVHFVGAGPGDAGLLSVRGADLLARAGAIVRDHDVPASLVGDRTEVEIAIVDRSSQSPEATASLLHGLVGRHETVVRLVRGDPFSAPRAPGEASLLGAAGVAFEVVAGIPVGLAAATCAGIPVGVADLVVSSPSPSSSAEAIMAFGAAAGVATFMASGRADDLLAVIGRLRDVEEAGADAALIEQASLPGQRTTVGAHAEIVDALRAAEPAEEFVFIAGRSVAERSRLAWFESRPLFGRRVVVTRPRTQSAAFATRLEALGAEVVQFPTIRIHPMPDAAPLREAAGAADTFDWVVFTSVNGVAHFWSALRDAGRDSRSLAGVSICAIGPATAAALELEGVRADLVPERYVAESVIEAIVSEVGDLAGSRILLPRAERARSILPDELGRLGADVVEVAAYRTVPDSTEANELRRRLTAGEIDLVTFTSSSTVQNFVDLVGSELAGARVASIGPITSQTARSLGLKVAIEAVEHTVPGLIQAIVEAS